jgi:2-polyprenyl-3-methyl-5-hydroxy-6-metoxy-1,4-benzoquinol methylase
VSTSTLLVTSCASSSLGLTKFDPLTHAVLTTTLQVGCGVGNSIFPLLDINPQLRVFACDFSATAVQIVQQHPQYAGKGTHTAAATQQQQQQQQQEQQEFVEWHA